MIFEKKTKRRDLFGWTEGNDKKHLQGKRIYYTEE